jgi:deoxyribodipyrimidine photo-lyase
MSTALYVLSNDLRLADNPAFARAANADALIVVYCIDPRWFAAGRYGMPAMGKHRWRFIIESLDDLAQQLQHLGQQLHIVFGHPVNALRAIIADTAPNVLVTSRPQGWYERDTWLALAERFRQLPIAYIDNTTLFEQADGDWLQGDLPKQFTPFRHIAERQHVRAPIARPTSLPPPPHHTAQALQDLRWDTQNTQQLPPWATATPKGKAVFTGGEARAQEHLGQYMGSAAPGHYKATRNALDGWQNSSKWSSWLSQGCLSPQQLFAAIAEFEARHGANDSTAWLRVELLWREYFQWLAPRMGRKLFRFRGLRQHAPLTSYYAERFQRWCEGNTPYPLVNACMRELTSTGYMSNRGRQIVASCLVNELQIDWRFGAAWFEHQLVDYNVAGNWGNWQYIAGVGVDPRGGRHFDLNKQQRQFDPDHRFVRHWLGDDFVNNTPVSADSVDAADWPISPQ